MSELCKYGWSVVKSTAVFNETLFYEAVKGNYLEIAMHLYPFILCKSSPENDTFEYSFMAACENGHLKVVQWLLDNIRTMSNFYYTHSFYNACKKGHLEVAKWLLSKFPNIKASNAHIFRMVCSNGHLKVAQWLLAVTTQNGIPKIDVTAKSDGAFRNACTYGHVEVAQWLASICPTKYVLVYNHNIVTYKILHKLPIIGASRGIETDCPICFERTCDIVATTCKHSFCHSCISEWWTNNRKDCPVCRATMTAFYIYNHHEEHLDKCMPVRT